MIFFTIFVYKHNRFTGIMLFFFTNCSILTYCSFIFTWSYCFTHVRNLNEASGNSYIIISNLPFVVRVYGFATFYLILFVNFSKKLWNSLAKNMKNITFQCNFLVCIFLLNTFLKVKNLLLLGCLSMNNEYFKIGKILERNSVYFSLNNCVSINLSIYISDDLFPLEFRWGGG